MKKFLLSILFFIVLSGVGYTDALVQYVNTASSGGDGSTNATSGATAAFASLNSWEAQNLNLTDDGGDTLTVYCSGTAADTTAVVFDGWTLSADCSVTIIGDNDTGVYSTDHYRLSVTGTVFHAARGYITFDSIQFGISPDGNNQYCFDDFYGTAPATFNNCIFQGDGGSSYYIKGIKNTSYTIKINNCVFSKFTHGSYSAGVENSGAGSIVISNSVITDNYIGVARNNGTVTIVNSVVFNNTNDIDGTVSITYSAGDDADFDSGTGNIRWDNSSTDWSANFTDYSNGDFSIVDTDSDLYDNGTTPEESKDITGYTWVTDDIGAFAYQVTTTNTQGLLTIW